MNTILHLGEMTVEAFERDTDGSAGLPRKAADPNGSIKTHLEREGIENLALLRVSLTSREKDRLSPQPRASWEKINPTKYNVLVEGAGRPFVLVFGETFDNGWRARVVGAPGSNGDELGSPHFMTNGFGNEWMVEVPEGESRTYRMELEYAPQRLYRIGLGLSGFFFAATFLWVGGAWIREKRAMRS